MSTKQLFIILFCIQTTVPITDPLIITNDLNEKIFIMEEPSTFGPLDRNSVAISLNPDETTTITNLNAMPLVNFKIGFYNNIIQAWEHFYKIRDNKPNDAASIDIHKLLRGDYKDRFTVDIYKHHEGPSEE